jgi:hypothetical protein
MTNTAQAIYAVPDAEQAGAIVYWRLSGTINAAQLEEAWQNANLALELLPETPSPEAALRRAVYEQKERRRLARKLPNGKGWALVNELVDGDDLEYEISIRVFLNKVGQVEFEMPEDVRPEEQQMCTQIEASFYQHLDELSAADVSAWLVGFSAKCSAVSLRERGGIYFVPRQNLAYWRSAYKAIQSVSGHSCYEIPALKSDEAVDAILDAVTREAQAAAEAMAEELASGDLQSRALANREERCTSMLAKLKQYEDLLGRSMGAITDRVGDLKAEIATAALATMGDLG